MLNTEVLILGAGVAGLSTAYFLKRKRSIIIEKESRAGGLMRTDFYSNSYFDKTGHLLHLRTDDLKRLIEVDLGVTLTKIERDSKIFTHGIFMEYPFQVNLNGLPREVIARCLIDFITTRLNRKKHRYRSFKEFIYGEFGAGIAEEFLIPYNSKIWTLPPDQMSPGFCEKYIPVPKIEDVVAGALGIIKKGIGYNASFYYPQRGGIEAVIKGFLRHTSTEILLKTRPVRINLAKRLVYLSDNNVFHFDHLVSSIPLKEFVLLIEDAPESIRDAARRLTNTQVTYFNIITKRTVDRLPHWVYLPEKEIPFYRVGSYSAFTRELTLPEYNTFYLEFSHRSGVSCDVANLSRRIPSLLCRLGFITGESDIIDIKPYSIDYAYVIFDKHYQSSTKRIFDYLKRKGILSIGRYGRWEYAAMQDAIMNGREAAQKILKMGKH